MVMVLILGKMEDNMLVIGLMESNMERVVTDSLMAQKEKEHGKMERE